MELTTTPRIGVDNNQFTLRNDFEHLTTYGSYHVNLEIANNEIKSTNNIDVVRRSNKQFRWRLAANGEFDYTKNIGSEFAIDTVSDRDYLRDYDGGYLAFTQSKVNLDYIHGRTYHGISAVKFQELENLDEEKQAPIVLPVINSYIETKPIFFKEKYSLASNLTIINRESGLQYKRVSVIPEVNVPFNLKGNLFNINAKAQGDLYFLENNYKYNQTASQTFDKNQNNLSPEASINWRLPMIKKLKNGSLLIEPMANIVNSSTKKNFNHLPNEDSNNTELTVNNLFITDRISGYDRNENGQRASYGVKSSLFNKYGEFGLTLGQSYKKSSSAQDVSIRGFEEGNKSNIVGQAMYKAKKYFAINYAFQLNQSNFRNEVNEINSSLTFDKAIFGIDYLLIRKNSQNSSEREQASMNAKIKLSKKWNVKIQAVRDLVEGRTLQRSVEFLRDGCCTIFGFSIIENNHINLIKSERTFSLNLSFKNL